MQKIFRCKECQRGIRIVGSTGLAKEVMRKVICPYCKKKNKAAWPHGDQFNVQRVGTG